MISGSFGNAGELFFPLDLISIDAESIIVDGLLDTGFTTGWLAVNIQDAESLGWLVMEFSRSMQTVRGEEFFDLYEGKVVIDGREFIIPVHASEGIPEVLLGLQWLRRKRLVVDFPTGELTLG
ncbi:MAG: aspartyl protease [Kamptonema sp. SIO1D9]|nr:aspartyl protease [Kamptonema sp. SIO1D9]